MAGCSLNKENDRAENKSEKCVTADEEEKSELFKKIYIISYI